MLGHLPAAEMRDVSRHLLRGCPDCNQVTANLWEPCDEEFGPLDAVHAESAASQESCDEYDAVLDRVFERIAATEAVVARERALGGELFEELLRHSSARQHLLVANSARFRNRMLCERLLEASHEERRQDPARALDLAKLAISLLDRLGEGDCGGAEQLDSLRARTWAHLGNAFRINADHAAAERAFVNAEALLDGPGRVGLLDRARVLDLLSSLRKDQSRFGEAALLLDRVAAIYQKLGQWHLLGRTFQQKALVCGESGDSAAEMTLLRRALDLIDPQEDPRLFLGTRHNLINALHEAGRSREAYALLFHTRPLYLKMGDRMNLLRLRWLEGVVAQGLQRIEQAEVAFREVRDAYAELGLDYNAALASLDLAGLYILQGRTSDVRGLAEEMLAIFQSREIHREATAALLVFCTAARLEQAELALVREVSDFLKRSRNNPELRFTRSS